MENTAISYVGLFFKGQSQEEADVIIAVDTAKADELRTLAKKVSYTYDETYGFIMDDDQVPSKIEYVTEAIQEEIPCEIVTDVMSRLDL